MIEFIQSVPKLYVIVALVAFGVGMFLVDNRAYLLGLLPKFTPSKAAPDRKKALSAFDDAVSYLEAVGCHEGVEAMKLALPHFLHSNEFHHGGG